MNISTEFEEEESSSYHFFCFRKGVENSLFRQNSTSSNVNQELFMLPAPNLFFDLTASKHIDLFAPCKTVMGVIPLIASYLKSLQLGSIEVDIPEGAFLVNPESIFIGKGTVVEPGAYIQGPCWIGENCTVRHGAYIRGNCIAEKGVVIGHATEVKNAFFFSGAHAAHFAYVGDSILGHKVNLGAGVKLANVRFDKQEVHVYFENVKYATGLRKFGAIIGDRSQIGCNAVLGPGALLGPDSACLPCEWVKGTRFESPSSLESIKLSLGVPVLEEAFERQGEGSP